MRLQLPVVIVDGYDVSIYSSLSDAAGALEPADVRGGGVTAYDGLGRVLELQIVRERRRILFGLIPREVEAVRINESPAATYREAELRQALIGYLTATNATVAKVEEMATADLVRIVREHQS